MAPCVWFFYFRYFIRRLGCLTVFNQCFLPPQDMFTFQGHFLTVSQNAVDYQDGKNYVNNREVSFPLNSISDRITPMGSRGKEMSWGLLKRVKLLLKIILAIRPQNNEIRHYYFYRHVSVSCVFGISSRVLATAWRSSQPDWWHWFERKKTRFGTCPFRLYSTMSRLMAVCALACSFWSMPCTFTLRFAFENPPFSSVPAKLQVAPRASVSFFWTPLN